MTEDKKIAFDFDGVIADTNQKKMQWMQKHGFHLINCDKTSFYQELSQTKEKVEIDRIYKNMGSYIFRPEILEETMPVQGAIETIQKLAQKFEIYIITARTESMINPVNNWLEKYHIKNKIKQVISSSYEPKQEICLKRGISFLCDDDIRHLIDKKVKTRVLFNNKKKENKKDIWIVKSWEEIEQCLNTVEEENRGFLF